EMAVTPCGGLQLRLLFPAQDRGLGLCQPSREIGSENLDVARRSCPIGVPAIGKVCDEDVVILLILERDTYPGPAEREDQIISEFLDVTARTLPCQRISHHSPSRVMH